MICCSCISEPQTKCLITKASIERVYGDERKTYWKEACFAQIKTGYVLGTELDCGDSPHAMRRRLQLAFMFS